MISRHLKAKSKRLHDADLLPSGTIAQQLGQHHSTVERVLRQAGAAESLGPPALSTCAVFCGFRPVLNLGNLG